MPEKCRVMTEEETEYEGGFFNFVAAAVCTVASFGCSVAASVTGNDDLNKVAMGLDVTSAALSFGVGGVAGSAIKTAAKGVAVSGIKKQVAKSVGVKLGQTDYQTFKAAGIIGDILSIGVSIGSIPVGGPFGILNRSRWSS